MSIYIRVVNNKVWEVIESEQPISELFTAEVAQLFEVCTTDVAIGYIKQNDGTFSPPLPPTSETTE